MFKDKADGLAPRRAQARRAIRGGRQRPPDRQCALRLNVALIDTRDASTLWSGRYASPQATSSKSRTRPAAESCSTSDCTMDEGGRRTDPQAYAMYVRAKALIRERNWPKMREARELLEEAVQDRPRLCAGLGAACWCHHGSQVENTSDYSSGNVRAQNARALMAARKAVALDPDLAEAHQMLAFVIGFHTTEGAEPIFAMRFSSIRANPQTLYWWGNAAALAGNSPLQERAVRGPWR